MPIVRIDTKNDPFEVMEAVNACLLEYGLEFVENEEVSVRPDLLRSKPAIIRSFSLQGKRIGVDNRKFPKRVR